MCLTFYGVRRVGRQWIAGLLCQHHGNTFGDWMGRATIETAETRSVYLIHGVSYIVLGGTWGTPPDPLVIYMRL